MPYDVIKGKLRNTDASINLNSDYVQFINDWIRNARSIDKENQLEIHRYTINGTPAISYLYLDNGVPISSENINTPESIAKVEHMLDQLIPPDRRFTHEQKKEIYRQLYQLLHQGGMLFSLPTLMIEQLGVHQYRFSSLIDMAFATVITTKQTASMQSCDTPSSSGIDSAVASPASFGSMTSAEDNTTDITVESYFHTDSAITTLDGDTELIPRSEHSHTVVAKWSYGINISSEATLSVRLLKEADIIVENEELQHLLEESHDQRMRRTLEEGRSAEKTKEEAKQKEIEAIVGRPRF